MLYVYKINNNDNIYHHGRVRFCCCVVERVKVSRLIMGPGKLSPLLKAYYSQAIVLPSEMWVSQDPPQHKSTMMSAK